MEIKVSKTAAREGILRLRLRRIPDESYVLHAFRLHGKAADPISRAYIYGRGKDSTASEQSVVVFRSNKVDSTVSYTMGEQLKILAEGTDGGYEDIELDVVEVE